jgi:hypothetical protein
MIRLKKSTILYFILFVLFSSLPIPGASQSAENSSNTGAALGFWDWGHIRIVRSNDNIEFLNRLHATVNQNGGGLVVMGLSSSKDENGLQRQNLGLSELLGFDLQEAPVSVTRREAGKGRVVFIPLNPIPVGRGDTENSPLPDDQLMYGQGKFPDRIKDAFGSLPEAVKWAAANEFSGQLFAPYTIEMTTMEQKEKNLLLVHLVNYHVTLDGMVTPAINARVRLLIPDNKKVSRVTVGSPINKTTAISFDEEGKNIEFLIPTFDIYSLATVYFE